MESLFDVAILSRLQFAFTISFHILWPTLTIGLISFLTIFLVLWMRTGESGWLRLYRFWSKIFALAFGVGVVTGIPLSYQFGTNFSAFSDAAGPVLGPLLGVEVMTAFFLEAAFIGVMLFGWGRVKPRIILLATVMVALGTHNSAFWIIVANSWMQTPAGVEFINGQYQVQSWSEVIFNPSMAWRIPHMLVACYISTALVIASVSSWYLLKKRHDSFARSGLRATILALALLAPLQVFIGDMHGLNTLEHQPAKVAAMEGLWETKAGVPLVLFAIPDQEQRTNHYALEIPNLASMILTHKWDGEIKGLNEFEEQGLPPVATVFFSFRVMVALGSLFIALGIFGAWCLFRGNLWQRRWLLGIFVLSGPAGFVATLAGWFVTETGRQPWIIYGLMKTSDGLSNVPASSVLVSLVAFMVVYALMFIAFIYYASALVRKGPESNDAVEEWLAVVTHTAHLRSRDSGSQRQAAGDAVSNDMTDAHKGEEDV